MKKSKILSIAIFIIAAAAVLYFAYGVVKKRYISPKKNNTGTTNSEKQNGSSDQESSQSGNPAADQFGSEQVNDPSVVDNAAPADGRPNVQSANCDNDCAGYKDSADNLKYCQEVCGIRPATPKDSAGQCENLTGLDQDSCWKDLAVSKKDFSFCEKISDAKLQRVCENRVTEEVLN
jgi:hypothetical protein